MSVQDSHLGLYVRLNDAAHQRVRGTNADTVYWSKIEIGILMEGFEPYPNNLSHSENDKGIQADSLPLNK